MKLSLDTLNQEPKYLAALRIIQELTANGHMAFLVGGCVRDRHMGHRPLDYDIASSALPEQVAEVFSKKPFKVVPTGLEHGTLTVVFHAHAYEVTTLRKDVETDGRRAKVSFGSSLEEDAARRDFTMNAMFEDPNGAIKDFFNGRKHIAQKQLFFVGDAHERIQEDYLRIMRFFRFKTRFKLSSDRETLAAIKKHHQGLSGISRERISKELWGLLSCREVRDDFKAMVESKVLPLIFAEVDPKGVVFSQLADLKELANLGVTKIASDELAYARLAFICLRSEQTRPGFRDWGEKELLTVLKGFRLSNASLQKILGAVVVFKELSKLLKADTAQTLIFADKLESYGGKGVLHGFYFPFWEAVFKQCQFGTVYEESLRHLINTEEKFGKRRTRKLPINGKEVMREFSLSSGSEVGEALSFIKKSFLNGDWETKEQAMQCLRHYFGKKSSSWV
ncbi:MAG: hypothetical protein HRU09_06735 [Oligoflexales bacterium]|nr:hypothetical protein [Oligoflexales bacterium]